MSRLPYLPRLPLPSLSLFCCFREMRKPCHVPRW